MVIRTYTLDGCCNRNATTEGPYFHSSARLCSPLRPSVLVSVSSSPPRLVSKTAGFERQRLNLSNP
jgi:hypothetical protein